MTINEKYTSRQNGDTASRIPKAGYFYLFVAIYLEMVALITMSGVNVVAALIVALASAVIIIKITMRHRKQELFAILSMTIGLLGNAAILFLFMPMGLTEVVQLFLFIFGAIFSFGAFIGARITGGNNFSSIDIESQTVQIGGSPYPTKDLNTQVNLQHAYKESTRVIHRDQ